MRGLSRFSQSRRRRQGWATYSYGQTDGHVLGRLMGEKGRKNEREVSNVKRRAHMFEQNCKVIRVKICLGYVRQLVNKEGITQPRIQILAESSISSLLCI